MKNHVKVIISLKKDPSLGGQKTIIVIIIGPFSRGGLEKPNPARTIDTLADGS